MSENEWFVGCLLGGAIGDALGAAVEFDSIDVIRARFGAAGIEDFARVYGGLGRITDDTQMTLFTLEGLIRARHAERIVGRTDVVAYLHDAYLRWLHTQKMKPGRAMLDGWLLEEPHLHHRRAPGGTCVSALKSTRDGQPWGSFTVQLNDSKGCGGVMRVAPVALWSRDFGETFTVAAQAAALTHSHPSGYLSAGALAVIVAAVGQGADVDAALSKAEEQLGHWPEHEETSTALQRARVLASEDPTPERIAETLGGGWVGEEALAIGVCAALSAEDFPSGVRLAVNHSGDSDSTGSIAGNILGAYYGVDALPQHWLERLELRDVIGQLAEDGLTEFSRGDPDPGLWRERYPVNLGAAPQQR